MKEVAYSYKGLGRPVLEYGSSVWDPHRVVLNDRFVMRNSLGRLLVCCVPMLEQRNAKLILNSVLDILNLTHLFTVPSQKVTLP